MLFTPAFLHAVLSEVERLGPFQANPGLKVMNVVLLQHWTISVSREETLAVREKFRKVCWSRPNHKPKMTQIVAWAKSGYVSLDDLRYSNGIGERVTDRMLSRHCEHIGVDPDQRLLDSGLADFETWIDWVLHTTKKETHETISQLWKWLCQTYSVLAMQPMDTSTIQQVRRVRLFHLSTGNI